MSYLAYTKVTRRNRLGQSNQVLAASILRRQPTAESRALTDAKLEEADRLLRMQARKQYDMPADKITLSAWLRNQ